MIDEIRYGIAECSLGLVLIARTARGLCATMLGDDAGLLRGDLGRRFPQTTLLPVSMAEDALLRQALALVESPGQRA